MSYPCTTAVKSTRNMGFSAPIRLWKPSSLVVFDTCPPTIVSRPSDPSTRFARLPLSAALRSRDGSE